MFAPVIMSLMTAGLIEAIVTDKWAAGWVKVVLLTVIAAAIGHSIVRAWRAFSLTNRARRRGISMSMAEASGEPRGGARGRQRRAIAGGTDSARWRCWAAERSW